MQMRNVLIVGGLVVLGALLYWFVSKKRGPVQDETPISTWIDRVTELGGDIG